MRKTDSAGLKIDTIANGHGPLLRTHAPALMGQSLSSEPKFGMEVLNLSHKMLDQNIIFHLRVDIAGGQMMMNLERLAKRFLCKLPPHVGKRHPGNS